MQAVHERVQTSEDSSFRCFSIKLAEFKFLWHFHPECELTLITGGRGKRYIGDSIEEYEAGDLVLLVGGVPHTWQSDIDQKREQKAIVLQFSEALFQNAQKVPLIEFQNIAALLQKAKRGAVIRTGKELISAMKKLPEKKGVERLVGLYTLLESIVESGEMRLLASEGFRPELAASDQKLFDQVHKYLQANLTETLSIDSVAAVHHMTPSTFRRFFKRNSGKTMIEYVNNLRIGKSCELLMGTELTVIEVAFRAGFTNLSHFNRMFLRLRSMTPTHYRALLRQRRPRTR